MLYSKECICVFYNDVSLGGTQPTPIRLCAVLSMCKFGN